MIIYTVNIELVVYMEDKKLAIRAYCLLKDE